MKWPVDIIEKIAKRKVVLFLGAGVSAMVLCQDLVQVKMRNFSPF